MPVKEPPFVRCSSHSMGAASVAAFNAASRGMSGKYEALLPPVCFILMCAFALAPLIATLIFMLAPFLNITKPRPPRKITILSIKASPPHVPAIDCVDTSSSAFGAALSVLPSCSRPLPVSLKRTNPAISSLIELFDSIRIL